MFGALLKAFDHKGPAEIEPKRAWTFRQVHWLAHRAGIADRHAGAPSVQLARRCRAWPGRARRTAATPSRYVCETVLRHVWRGGADAEEPARFAALARQLAPRARSGERRGQAAAARARPTQRSARGVFGVPTLGIDDKLFWGFDALDMAAALLRGDPWFDAPHWQREGAPRPGVKRAVKRAG